MERIIRTDLVDVDRVGLLPLSLTLLLVALGDSLGGLSGLNSSLTRGLGRHLLVKCLDLQEVDDQAKEIICSTVQKYITRGLASEAIESTALPLQGIHYIHCSDSLPLSMLSVGDGITDNILQENLQDTPSLLVDEA